ncbi:hypothetical protein KY285_028351 [Solanum tuberosum]|nr:hypothetical protein KY285_028351 [Solanum tuberosum]
MAGIASCLMSNTFAQDWIVDSGATHHITADAHLLTKNHSLTKSQMNQVYLPTGDKVEIIHIGEVSLFNNENDLYSGKVKGIGKEEGGLYIFKGGITTQHKKKDSMQPSVGFCRSSSAGCYSMAQQA